MSVNLSERLHADMIAAMKARDKTRLGVLRMLNAAVKDAAIDKKEDLKDDEVMRLVMSYAKKREESIAGAEKAGRDDLIAQERDELAVVQEYLPQPLSDEELAALVATAIEETSADSMKDMGRVMKLCQDRAAGRADGSRLSALVKALLSS